MEVARAISHEKDAGEVVRDVLAARAGTERHHDDAAMTRIDLIHSEMAGAGIIHLTVPILRGSVTNVNDISSRNNRGRISVVRTKGRTAMSVSEMKEEAAERGDLCSRSAGQTVGLTATRVAQVLNK